MVVSYGFAVGVHSVGGCELGLEVGSRVLGFGFET